MSNPFSKDLFGGGQPQRRVLKGRITTDAQGNLVFQPLKGEAHLISDENSLDTIEPEFDAFYDGCLCNVNTNPAGGHCGEPGCPCVVCVKHLAHCSICSKPLCLQHLHHLEIAPNQRVPVCPAHYREGRRRHLWQKVVRTALRPFVQFGDEGGSK